MTTDEPRNQRIERIKVEIETSLWCDPLGAEGIDDFRWLIGCLEESDRLLGIAQARTGSASFEAGRRAGYQDGWSDGYEEAVEIFHSDSPPDRAQAQSAEEAPSGVEPLNRSDSTQEVPDE